MKFIKFDIDKGDVIEFCCDDAKRLYNQHDIVYVNKFCMSLRPKKENPDIQYLEQIFFCFKCGKSVK